MQHRVDDLDKRLSRVEILLYVTLAVVATDHPAFLSMLQALTKVAMAGTTH